MSGGYFQYDQYKIHAIACAIEELIESNDDKSLNEYGYPRGQGYKPETIARFKDAVRALKIAEVYAQRVDWLVSDDDSEDSFHSRLADELAKLEVK